MNRDGRRSIGDDRVRAAVGNRQIRYGVEVLADEQQLVLCQVEVGDGVVAVAVLEIEAVGIGTTGQDVVALVPHDGVARRRRR